MLVKVEEKSQRCHIKKNGGSTTSRSEAPTRIRDGGGHLGKSGRSGVEGTGGETK